MKQMFSSLRLQPISSFVSLYSVSQELYWDVWPVNLQCKPTYIFRGHPSLQEKWTSYQDLYKLFDYLLALSSCLRYATPHTESDATSSSTYTEIQCGL